VDTETEIDTLIVFCFMYCECTSK